MRHKRTLREGPTRPLLPRRLGKASGTPNLTPNLGFSSDVACVQVWFGPVHFQTWSDGQEGHEKKQRSTQDITHPILLHAGETSRHIRVLERNLATARLGLRNLSSRSSMAMGRHRPGVPQLPLRDIEVSRYDAEFEAEPLQVRRALLGYHAHSRCANSTPPRRFRRADTIGSGATRAGG